MNVLIAGGCGFIGSELCIRLAAEGHRVTAFDSMRREGSERNVPRLALHGVNVIRGDIRSMADIQALPQPEWVIDAAAEPSVMADRRLLIDHNLIGTLNLLEFAASWMAGVVFLSTSRVYSIYALCRADFNEPIRESFPTTAPVSMYGATKLAGEVMAREYGDAYGRPVIVNRCGVVAGSGQFGKSDQGIFSWWIRQWRDRKPLNYIGFGGTGSQIRDVLHPSDLAELVVRQIDRGDGGTFNVGGGPYNARSLADLSAWCRERFGPHDVGSIPEMRRGDVPWVVMDNAKATETYGWKPTRTAEEIFEEIACGDL